MFICLCLKLRRTALGYFVGIEESPPLGSFSCFLRVGLASKMFAICSDISKCLAFSIVFKYVLNVFWVLTMLGVFWEVFPVDVSLLTLCWGEMLVGLFENCVFFTTYHKMNKSDFKNCVFFLAYHTLKTITSKFVSSAYFTIDWNNISSTFVFSAYLTIKRNILLRSVCFRYNRP